MVKQKEQKHSVNKNLVRTTNLAKTPCPKCSSSSSGSSWRIPGHSSKCIKIFRQTGCLVDLVGRVCISLSQGHEFKPHVGVEHTSNKQTNEQKYPEEQNLGEL